MKKIILYIAMLFLISSLFVSADAPDSDWTSCRDVTINNNASTDRGNQSILINITGVNIVSSAVNEIRIANSSCNDGGKFINSTVADSDDSSWVLIAFITESSHSVSSDLNYSIYYNTSSPVNPNYETKLTLYDEFDGTDLSSHTPDFTSCGAILWLQGGQQIGTGLYLINNLDNPSKLNVSSCVSNTTHRALIMDGQSLTSAKDKSMGWDSTFTVGNDFAEDTVYASSAVGTTGRMVHANTLQNAYTFDLTTFYSYTTRLHPDDTVSASIYNDTKLYVNVSTSSSSYGNSHHIIANAGSSAPNGRLQRMLIWNGTQAEFVTGYFPQSQITVGNQELLAVAPETPVLTSPDNNTFSNVNITLTYSSVGADTFFVFQDFNNSNPTTLVCDNTPSASCQVNATSGDGSYFWKVVGSNAFGNSSDSEIRLWNYDSELVMITLTSPQSDNSTLTQTSQRLNVTLTNTNLDAIIVNVTNPSGTELYRNETLNLAVATFNIDTVLTLSETGTYTIRAFGNDSTGSSTTEFFTFIGDVQAPTFTGLINDYTNGSASVTFNLTINDDNDLASYILMWNDTGVNVNDSSVLISGVTQNISVQKTITASNNTGICASVFGFDSAGNVNQSDNSCLTVIDSPVPASQFLFLSIVPLLFMALIFSMLVKAGLKQKD